MTEFGHLEVVCGVQRNETRMCAQIFSGRCLRYSTRERGLRFAMRSRVECLDVQLSICEANHAHSPPTHTCTTHTVTHMHLHQRSSSLCTTLLQVIISQRATLLQRTSLCPTIQEA